MMLVFSPAATPEQRAAVTAALERRGIGATERDTALVLDGPLTRDGAVEVAAMPGVAQILPAGGQATMLDAILDRVAGAAAVLGVLVLLAANFPAPLGGPADPLRTPVVRPSWPLLAWYGAVDRAPSWVPVPLVFLACAALLLFWPFVGRGLAERRPALHTALGLLAVFFTLGLAAMELVR